MPCQNHVTGLESIAWATHTTLICWTQVGKEQYMTTELSVAKELFIGITTWNSELLLPLCLDSLAQTAPDSEIVVLDNMSVDDTRKIANEREVRVVTKRCGQADALNELVRLSDRPYTLLIHADVIMIPPNWIDIVLSRLKNDIALVSPEDIGCGPYTRPWVKANRKAPSCVLRRSI